MRGYCWLVYLFITWRRWILIYMRQRAHFKSWLLQRLWNCIRAGVLIFLVWALRFLHKWFISDFNLFLCNWLCLGFHWLLALITASLVAVLWMDLLAHRGMLVHWLSWPFEVIGFILVEEELVLVCCFIDMQLWIPLWSFLWLAFSSFLRRWLTSSTFCGRFTLASDVATVLMSQRVIRVSAEAVLTITATKSATNYRTYILICGSH